MCLNDLPKENKLFFRGYLLHYMHYMLSLSVAKSTELEHPITQCQDGWINS